MNSVDLIKELKSVGYVLVSIRGSHHKFSKGGRIEIVPHPKKDLPKPMVAAIRKRVGLK